MLAAAKASKARAKLFHKTTKRTFVWLRVVEETEQSIMG